MRKLRFIGHGRSAVPACDDRQIEVRWPALHTRSTLRLHRFDELDEYMPEGHEGVVNRLLVGAESGGEGAVSVWHGRLDPGGHSELHVHPESLQIYIGISGEMVVGDESEEHALAPLATAIIAAAAEHFIENRSDDPAEVLVISVPGLR